MFFVLLFLVGSCTKNKKTKDAKILHLKATSVPGDPHNQGFREFVKTLDKLSDGTIKVAFYDSGTLFGQDELYPTITKGNIDLVLDFSAGWYSEYVDYISMFTAGYMFKNYEHMTKVLNGEIGKKYLMI